MSRFRGSLLFALGLLALLLTGCVEFDAMVATPTPATTATAAPSPTITAEPPPTPGGPTPTVLVDIFSLLPEGHQPLAVNRIDFDGDETEEWVVLGGKSGQPTFEVVQPFVLGVVDNVAQVLWSGQADFAVQSSGELRLEDLTGDGRPEIIYLNKTVLGGTYGFVYGGGPAGEHPLLSPQGGPLEGVGFFAGWQIELLPPGEDGRRAISTVTDLAGTRWLYRWAGENFRADAMLQGTPFPTSVVINPAPTPEPDKYDVTHDLNIANYIDKVIGDMDGDGAPEIAVLYTITGMSDLRIAIFAHRAPPGFPQTYRIAWTSGPLVGIENQVFRFRDITNDGRPELLNGQGGGGAGTLYIVGGANGLFDLIRPSGGRFDGRDSLGDGDYVVREISGAPPEISGVYDEGASADVYQWDNGVFRFRRTE